MDSLLQCRTKDKLEKVKKKEWRGRYLKKGIRKKVRRQWRGSNEEWKQKTNKRGRRKKKGWEDYLNLSQAMRTIAPMRTRMMTAMMSLLVTTLLAIAESIFDD